MGMKVGVGLSTERNPNAAAREAVAMARERGTIGTIHQVLMFATCGHDQESLLKAVRAETGRAPLVGCSGEGVITNAISIEEPYALLVGLIEAPDMRFSLAAAEGLKSGSDRAGAELGRAFKSHLADDTVGIFVFADGLTINFDRFKEGIERELGAKRHIPLLGGTAGDHWEFERTYQYIDDRVLSDGVSGFLLSGPMKVACAASHGAVPMGSERTVTRAEGNVIYEIDGKPALDALKEYLEFDEAENWAKAIVNVTLGFRASGDFKRGDALTIRYIPQKDDATGALTICTEVKAGETVWMTRRDHDKIYSGIEKLTGELKAALGGKQPAMVMQVDCAGRGKLIFTDEQRIDLLQRLQRGLDAEKVPWVGFHSYGEIGPVGSTNYFHNHTVIVSALY